MNDELAAMNRDLTAKKENQSAFIEFVDSKLGYGHRTKSGAVIYWGGESDNYYLIKLTINNFGLFCYLDSPEDESRLLIEGIRAEGKRLGLTEYRVQAIVNPKSSAEDMK